MTWRLNQAWFGHKPFIWMTAWFLFRTEMSCKFHRKLVYLELRAAQASFTKNFLRSNSEAVFRIRIRLIRIRIRIQPKISIRIRIPDPGSWIRDPGLYKLIEKIIFGFYGKKITFPPCCCLFIMRQCYTITQSAKNFHSVLVLKVSHSKFWLFKPIFRHPDSEYGSGSRLKLNADPTGSGSETLLRGPHYAAA